MRPLYRTLLLTGLLLILIGFFVSIGAFFGGASISHMQNAIRDGYRETNYHNTQEEGEWTDDIEENNLNDIIVFDKGTSISSIDISLSLAEVIIEKGSSFEIRTKDIPENEIRTSLSSGGNLRISNKDTNKLSAIFGARWINRNPQVIISLPDDLVLSNLSVAIGAGRFSSKEIDVKAEKARLEVGAGEIVFKNLHTKKLTADCGMGSIVLSGRIRGVSLLECGMGSINASIEGNRNEYSYNASVGLGNVRVNDEEISGFGNNRGVKKLDNHLDIECGMGDVRVTIE